MNLKHLNFLTFDVEHWYEGFRYRGIDDWKTYPPRDNRVLEGLLDNLAETGQRSTMFFTGRFAEEFPQVVRRAAQEGHEIASHSYSHVVLNKMEGIAEFRKDLLKSISILEDISGNKVKGYRAPKWSVTEENRTEVLSILHEAGLYYDSSVFPKAMGHKQPVFPHKITLENAHHIWEVPATTLPIFNFRIPVAGGLYFRLFPIWTTLFTLYLCNRQRQPGMIYLHPYDIDGSCPRLNVGNWLFQWLRYYGVADALKGLEKVITKYRFVPIIDWLEFKDSTP